MKEKNKVKKTLAAVSAVVAAGLMPGIVAASAADLPIQGSNVEIKMHDKRHRKIIVENVYENPSVSNTANGSDDTIYRSAEQMPRFPGGEAALMKYLESHINYPPEAAKNNVQGHVIVQFVVKKDGSISEVKVVRSLDKDLDKEAIRVIKSLPKFTPGRQDGKAVNVWYTLPVTFKLK